ncbi:MAG TPA: PKD domain-containing protein [Chitinophagaceae bacterium]
MKRLLVLISFPLFFALPSFANHITGGEMFYTITAQNGNSYTYHVVLKLYRDCNSAGAPLDANAPISIFDRVTGVSVWANSVPRNQIVTLNLGSPSPCITNPPAVCYQVGYYEFDVTLNGSPNGYVIAYQRCCRIAGINNLSGSSSVGATYTAEIPGTSQLITAPNNNSARFVGPDTVVVCAENAFTYSFAATDIDPNDQLSYSFCDAYLGGGSSIGTGFNNATPTPPSPPPYITVPYSGGGFNGSSPLGPTISINLATGLLTGIAPGAGIYVVTVCVTERRNGIVIATQRKDLQIKVGDCQIAQANLDPSYITCDGYSWTFSNKGDQTLINSYDWFFGDPASGVNNSSTLATPTHVFSDTGAFVVTLITNRFGDCSDTGTTIMKVYPGFFPGFLSTGTCYLNPVQFTDTTRTNYGVVNTWSWNFGETTTLADTSRLKNPAYTYPSAGPKTVNFIATNSKGCIDTITKTIDLLDKPLLNLAFRDTLTCILDNVQLQAIGTGNFSWTPFINVTNANTATPTVDPSTTTTYYVDLENGGCRNRDSVRVRVLNVIALAMMRDTTICRGDPVQLSAVTDGLTFLWTPATTLNNTTLLNPIATPLTTTTYQLQSSVGSCAATDNITVTVVPYPIANAGIDTTICYNTSAQLNGSHDGITFNWTPANYLNNPNLLNPIAMPPRTTPFVLSVFDNRGCPKAGRDTVIVNVLPRIRPFAGRDTAVIIGQPLQFNAEGGETYLWSPPIGLSSTTISNPIGLYDGSIDSIRYKVRVFNSVGCYDSAFVIVKVFKTNPYVFVPSAFTPNNDGRNDLIRPIAVGIQRINYFRIYNRWGQMVFSTSTNGHGWDGRINGTLQSTNTFVWLVSAVDYLGKAYFQKGTVTLIR